MTAWLAGVAACLLVLAAVRPGPQRVPGTRQAPEATQPSLRQVLPALDRVVPALRRHRRDRQLPDALDRLASALRAGVTVGPALVELAPDVADPLGGELQRIARSIGHGAPIAEALHDWAQCEDSSRDVRLVAAALTIGARAGGEVARAVDGVAATLRERHELQAETRALATQARASATLLSVAPLGFAALVATVEPGAIVFLLTSPMGLACLVAGVGLDAIGIVWMARITRGPA